ncbi:thiamine-phosphate kinase [Fretibacter rubidus]|uniref:thiamine-phosphate kinase n=1 Tax=Fretibacter rubidus TaxID=570162 RepID=UPI00352BC9B2
MSEFDFIKTYLAPLAGPEGLGLLDDAALLYPPAGHDLVLTKDTMVEGVHFPSPAQKMGGARGADTAERLIRTNLSDLAAKGATPLGYLLSLAFPRDMDAAYRAAFAKGLDVAQQSFPPLKLFGGDTVVTDGPMVVSATLIGTVPTGGMVTRSGAKTGDDIWLSGYIGDSAMGLKHVLSQKIEPAPTGADIWHWEEAYLRPEPRLDLRGILRSHATACADVSDGLLADCGHIARASGQGLSLNFGHISLSEATHRWVYKQADVVAAKLALLSAGDDYELVFTAPKTSRAALQASHTKAKPLTRIGHVTDGQGVTLRNAGGDAMDFGAGGYAHF